MNPNRYLRDYWPVLLALGLYVYLAFSLDFIQDDAYITYRYVANYLGGDGLVYNIGERIEGFTNFGWTVLLIMLGALGANFIIVSKVIGLLFGGGIVWLTFLLARQLFGEDQVHYCLAAVLLVGSNQALAYWSPAGLETAAFSFFALWSFYLYLKRNWLLIFALAMAVWLRPEGAVVTGILIVVEAIQWRRIPRFTLISAAVAFALSLPYVGFKLVYYGSILPNPFYAKTSFTLAHFATGIQYVESYFEGYTLYQFAVGALLALLLADIFFKWLPPRFGSLWYVVVGLALYGFGSAYLLEGNYDPWHLNSFVVPLLGPAVIFLAYRTDFLSRPLGGLWLFCTAYLLYIAGIGGDVLYVHRFFLPLAGPIAILMVALLRAVLDKLRPVPQMIIVTPVALAMVLFAYLAPRDNVVTYNEREIVFTEKMQFKARQLKESDSTDFSVALATIGIFGYELLGHDIVDLVGLTDSTIARYSEDPIPGMETTWKEQKHNSRYLLQRAPDYIMFSTGIKPSAPAERALLLYRQFMDSYRTVGWYYSRPGSSRGVISSVFKKVRPVTGEIVPTYPVEYVQEYKLALDAHTTGDHVTAIRHYDRAARASPRPYFPYLIYQKAFSLQRLEQYDQAYRMLNALLVRDSMIFEAHLDLYRYAVFYGDSAKAETHKQWLLKLVPWYWPRIDSTIQAMLIQARQRQP